MKLKTVKTSTRNRARNLKTSTIPDKPNIPYIGAIMKGLPLAWTGKPMSRNAMKPAIRAKARVTNIPQINNGLLSSSFSWFAGVSGSNKVKSASQTT